jgi:hypothetical protein
MNRTVQTNLIVGGAIVAGLSLDPSGSVPAEQPTVPHS